MKTISKFQSIMMALCMALCLGACSESKNDEPDGPVKPDEPVADERFTVPLAGGTVIVDDITLQFDPLTFSEDVEVGISEVKASEITEDGRSKFYQLILPPSGTKKPFKVKLDCTGSTVNVRPMVKTIAWDPHSGTTSQVVFDIDASVLGSQIEATIPELSSDGKEKPYFTIGLAECPPVEETRANDLRYQYKVGASMWKYNANRAKYQEISEIVKATIPEASRLLSAIGFNVKTLVQYRLTSPKELTVLENCWGIHQPAWYGKSWNVVHLNEDFFMNYLENKTDSMKNDLKATIIHETLHAVTALLYDPRDGYRICSEGQKGNDWSQFDEGLGCWVEKFIGAKKISENTKKWQKNFILEFYPHTRNQDVCKDCGYGMASFIEYMAQKAGDTKIVDIYKAFIEETTSFRTVLKSFLANNSIQFFDVQSYYDFAFGVMNNKIVPQIDIDDCVHQSEEEEGKNDVMNEKSYTFKADAYNYGVLVHKLNIRAKYMKTYQDSLVSFNQHKPGVLTRIYYMKNNELTLLGQCIEDDNFVIDMVDLGKKTGIYGDTQPSMITLYFVTTRKEFKDDYSSMPSYIEIRVQNGEEEAGKLEVSPTLLEFEAEGGEQTITVKKGNFEKFGCYWEDVFKETHTIPYDGILYWNKLIDPFHDTFQEATRATFINDSTISIFVYKNESSQPRSTKLIVWAAESYLPGLSQEELEKEDYEEVAVTIKQKGGDIKPKVANISFSGKIHLTNGKENQSCNIPIFVGTDNGDIRGSLHETNPSGSGITIRDDTIMVERRGKGIHVIGRRKEVDTTFTPNRIFELNVSFDIYDCSGDEYTAIENLEYEEIHSEKDGEVTDKLKLSAGSIPYGNNNGYMTWDDDHYLGTSWRAEQSKNTLRINSVLRYIYRDYTGTVEAESYNSYTPDDNDYIGIYLYGKYLSPK